MTIASDQFLTQTLRGLPERDAVCRILAAAINRVDPTLLVQEHLSRQGSTVRCGDYSFDLHSTGQIIVVAIGKAALPMAKGAEEILGDDITHGIVLTKTDSLSHWDTPIQQFQIYTGGHPLPDPSGLQAAKNIAAVLEKLTKKDLVLLLISGGGSSLLSYPSDGISLEDLLETNSLLLNSGADIVEINTLRKHLSKLKGGWLAKIASPANVISLVLSDVIQDRIDMIASGPTIPDPSTFQDAMEVIKKYHLQKSLPTSVLKHLQEGMQGRHPETPKPGDPIFKKVKNQIIGDNQLALQAGLQQARAEGFFAQQIDRPLINSADETGSLLTSLLTDLVQNHKPFPPPACLIGGGEPTVQIESEAVKGHGGRSLETALHTVQKISGLKNGHLITLASDGEDGSTDAAGAVVSSHTLERATRLDFDPNQFLNDHTSYTFFNHLEDLIKIGPTQTNVNDLFFLFTTLKGS